MTPSTKSPFFQEVVQSKSELRKVIMQFLSRALFLVIDFLPFNLVFSHEGVGGRVSMQERTTEQVFFDFFFGLALVLIEKPPLCNSVGT